MVTDRMCFIEYEKIIISYNDNQELYTQHKKNK